MSDNWKCPNCGENYKCVQFSCGKCGKSLEGKITNLRFVEREVGLKEFFDSCKKIRKMEFIDE